MGEEVEEVERAAFVLSIQDNPNGWGPVGIPEQFKELPFQHFSKGDKIGKVADWTGQLYSGRARYAQQYATGQAGSAFAYIHDEEDASFHLVDTARAPKTAMQRANRMKQMQMMRKLAQKEKERRIAAGYGPARPNPTKTNFSKEHQRQFKQWQKRGGFQGRRYDHRAQNQRQRPPSVMIKPDWEVMEELDFPRLAKLNLPGIEGEDIPGEQYGRLEYYDKNYDRVTTRSEKALQRIQRLYFMVTTTEDPVIQKLARNGAGNVFATDVILATLMCSTRSVYSWDIVATRIGNSLFLDKRDKSDIDLLTVSETATEPPADEGNSINSPAILAQEATFINRNFSQQVLKKGEATPLAHPKIPFLEDDDEDYDGSIGYKYRKFTIPGRTSDSAYEVVVRTELDGVTTGVGGRTEYLTIKAFNEWDSRYSGGEDWRGKLESQKGALLATEMKNNSCKLAKWTVQAVLAGADQMKFGYVSRAHVRDSTKHVILGTQQFTPEEFSKNITLKMDNSWGILKVIIDKCMEQPPGKYLLLKDPNKVPGTLRLYHLPDKTFEDSDSEDDSEDDDDADDEATDQPSDQNKQ